MENAPFQPLKPEVMGKATSFCIPGPTALFLGEQVQTLASLLCSLTFSHCPGQLSFASSS